MALFRLTACAIPAGLVLIAAALVLPQDRAGATESAADAAPQPSAGGDHSLFGSYLAGRFAISERDRASAADYLSRALELDPENRMLLERTMVYRLSSGKMEDARELAPRVLASAPNNLGANLISGLAAFRSGEMDTARSFFNRGESGPIARLATGLMTMWTYQAEGRNEEARETLNALSEGSAFDAFRQYHMAVLSEMQGRIDDAREAYASAYEAARALRTVDAYGRFLERNGESAEALKIYDAFLEGSPTHPIVRASRARTEAGEPADPLVENARAGMAETLYSMGSALTQDGGGDLALIYLNLALFIEPDFSIAHFLVADIHDRQNRHEEAIDAYSSVEQSSPLKRESEIQAALNLDSLDRTEEALKRLDGLIAIDSTDIVALRSAGTLMRARQRFKEAEPYYSKAIALIESPSSTDWQLYYFRGITYERTERWPLAEADFKKALELEPDQPLVLNYLGYSWIDQGVNLDIAIDMVRKAVDQRPNDGYIVDSLGWAYYRLGDYERAVEELERAVELRPDDPVINDHLGDALWRVGRRVEAVFQWNHALAMDPEEEEIPKINAKIADGLPEENTDSVAGTSGGSDGDGATVTD